jgi:NAD+ synthase (glutamine-hydrolysing)
LQLHGSATELIFDGGSLVVTPGGEVYDEMKYFEEQITVYDLDEVIKAKIFRIVNNRKKNFTDP